MSTTKAPSGKPITEKWDDTDVQQMTDRIRALGWTVLNSNEIRVIARKEIQSLRCRSMPKSVR